MHPATAVDIDGGLVEANIVPGPYGLVELTSANVLLFNADSGRSTGYGLAGVAGKLWYDVGISLTHARRLANDADIGVSATAGIDGGADIDRRWYVLVTGGLRWRIDSAIVFGVSIANAVALGMSPSHGPHLAMGLGLTINDVTTATIDASMEPVSGLGIIAGIRYEAHPRLALRAAFRSRPMCLSAAVLCRVTPSTAVLLDVDVVTVLGFRSRLGVAWHL